MKHKTPYILMSFLLFALVACNKQQDVKTTDTALVSKTTITSDDDGGDLFTWDDEGIAHIEKWSPKTFAGMPLDSISRAMYDHLDVYQLSLFYKTGNDRVQLSIYDGEDEYVEPLIKPVQFALEKNISTDAHGRQSKVVTKKGIKAIESAEKINNKTYHKVSFIHKDRYVLIVSGNTDLNKLWDGITGLPLNNLK
jgi:hypothetical protein